MKTCAQIGRDERKKGRESGELSGLEWVRRGGERLDFHLKGEHTNHSADTAHEYCRHPGSGENTPYVRQ